MLKKITAVLLTGAIAAAMLTGCSNEKKITVGSMYFTENKLLAEMLCQVIEKNSDIKVERKLGMDGSSICFEAIKRGQIDIYPEYTGTALMNLLKKPIETDPDKTYDIVSREFDEQFKIKWMKPIGFNNTYALAMTEEMAKKYNIETASDLVPYAGDMIFGAEHQFFNRSDGYDGLIEKYGLKFKDVVKMDVSLKYQAVSQDKIQVTDAFTTDGQLTALKLKVLRDDKAFFPPYYAAPLVREDTLKKYPELEEMINKLGGVIDDKTMQTLNYKADNEKQDIARLAETFLKEKGLIAS